MKRSRTPTPVITAVLTLITIFCWAGFEVFRSFTDKQPPQVEEEIIRPLDPNLDIQSLSEIVNRPVLADTDLGNNIQSSASPSPTSSASPIPSTTPTASSSATLVPSPTP